MADLTARFEAGARDPWQRPAEVIETLAPFRVVIDLGAGTGYFARHLGPAAERVYAMEPERAFHGPLSAAGLTVCTAIADVPERVDLILAVNVLRYVSSWTEVQDALLPGGRLALIDWRPEETPVGPSVAERRPPPSIPGFKRLREHEILPYQWFIELERLD